jgi:excisionase family DNA binding protein
MSEREVFSVDEVAERLGLSRNSAYEAVRKGEIPSVRIGRRILVSRVALDRLLAGQQPVAAA